MTKTDSDRFTSLKKKSVTQNIKVNKFSSSGIGNFPAGNQLGLPPFSPTPATSCKMTKKVSTGPLDHTETEADICEQTDQHFVEYELKLNNQDQFQDDYQSNDSDIEENIVTASITSAVADDAQKKTLMNFRQKLQAKKDEEQRKAAQKITESEASTSQQPRFGTQIVNYKPSFAEDSSDQEEPSQEKSREVSNGKRTFQGRNFANLQEKPIPFLDQKENENTTNLSLRNKTPTLFGSAAQQLDDLCDEDDTSRQSHDQSDSHIYSRLKSTRHHKTKTRGFSPPIKMTDQ